MPDVEEAKKKVGFGGVDPEGPVTGIVAGAAAGRERRPERVEAVATGADHEISKAVGDDAFVKVIVTGEDGAGAPLTEGPEHVGGFAGPGAVPEA